MNDITTTKTTTTAIIATLFSRRLPVQRKSRGSPNKSSNVWQTHTQWLREGVCRPGQTSVLAPPPRNQTCKWSYGYNDGIGVDCEQYAKSGCKLRNITDHVDQLQLPSAKKKTAAHTFCTCLCWNKVILHYSVFTGSFF